MKKNTIFIKSGVITILLMLIWTIITYSVSIQNQFATLLQYLFFALGIYSSHYFYKKEYKYMPYIEGIKLGFGVSTIVGAFYGIMVYIALKFDGKKTVLKTMKLKISEALKAKGIDDVTIQSFINKVDLFVTPIKSAIFIFALMLIIGIIFSFIISIFSKKNNYNE